MTEPRDPQPLSAEAALAWAIHDLTTSITHKLATPTTIDADCSALGRAIAHRLDAAPLHNCPWCGHPPFDRSRECPAASHDEPEHASPEPAPLDEERLVRAVEEVLDVGRVQCRCGRWPLLDNWGNHRRRKDGRPHRPVSGQAARIIVRTYMRGEP